MTAPRFYTVAEAAQVFAEVLRLSGGTAGEQRVRRLIHSGEIRAVAIGRTYRIPSSEIERLTAA